MCFQARIGVVGASSPIKRPWTVPVDPTGKDGSREGLVEPDITRKRFPRGLKRTLMQLFAEIIRGGSCGIGTAGNYTLDLRLISSLGILQTLYIQGGHSNIVLIIR